MRRLAVFVGLLVGAAVACDELVTSVAVEPDPQCTHACTATPAQLVGTSPADSACTFSTECAPVCCPCDQGGKIQVAACSAGKCLAEADACRLSDVTATCEARSRNADQCVPSSDGDGGGASSSGFVGQSSSRVGPPDAGTPRPDGGLVGRDGGGGPADAGAPPQGLLGFWRFEGNIDDSSGAARHLMGIGRFTAGEVGQAYESGSGPSPLRQGDPALDVGAGDFTITAWVRFLAGADAARVIVSRVGPPVPSLQGWVFQRTSGGHLMWCVGDWMEGFGGCTPPADNVLEGSTALDVDTWFHVAVRRQGVLTTLFVDGVPEAEGELVQPARAEGPFVVGATLDTATTQMKGAIDELMMLGRALTNAEIRMLANAGGASSSSSSSSSGGGASSSSGPAVCGLDPLTGMSACDVVMYFDANRQDSWSGAGQQWNSVVQPPFAGETAADYRMHLGTDPANADSRDPVATVVAGETMWEFTEDQVLAMDGAATPFLRSLTGDGAAFTIEVAATLNPAVNFLFAMLFVVGEPGFMSAGGSTLGFWFSQDGLQLTVRNGSANELSVTSEALPVDGLEHVYAVTVDEAGATGSFWVDGARVGVRNPPMAAFDATYATPDNAGPSLGAKLGSISLFGSGPWVERVRVLRVFNRPLSPAEITDEYSRMAVTP